MSASSKESSSVKKPLITFTPNGTPSQEVDDNPTDFVFRLCDWSRHIDVAKQTNDESVRNCISQAIERDAKSVLMRAGYSERVASYASSHVPRLAWARGEMSFMDAVDRRRIASVEQSEITGPLDQGTYNDLRTAQQALEAISYEVFSDRFLTHVRALQESVARGMTLANGVEQMGLRETWKLESEESIRRQILNRWLDSEWITAEDGASLASLQGTDREKLISSLLANGQTVHGMKGVDLDEFGEVLARTDVRFWDYIDAFRAQDDGAEECDSVDSGQCD